MKHGERGAALIETALALPVILVAAYGLTWAVRQGTVAERSESAVRYAGVISAQQNPYHDYSLNAMYNNLTGATSNVQTSPCSAPGDLFLKGGTLPVVIPGTQQNQRTMPTFWLPDSSAGYCDKQTPQRQAFTGVTRSYLLLQSVPAVENTVTDGLFFNGSLQLFSNGQTEYKFYRSADMATLMHCVNGLGATVTNSLVGKATGARILPLLPGNFNSTPLSVSANCTSAIGSQAPEPPPVLPPPGTGQLPPSPPPSPLPSPSPRPTTVPTQQPSSPKPSAAPSAAVSPSPAASPTSGSGTGGGSGGGQAPPTTKPGGNGSPAPPCCGPPTSSPTAKPSGSPVTPAPSKPPSTPAPSATPTKAPTPKPQPSSPTPGPPGGIS